MVIKHPYRLVKPRLFIQAFRVLPGLGNQEQFDFHTDAIKKGTGRYSTGSWQGVALSGAERIAGTELSFSFLQTLCSWFSSPPPHHPQQIPFRHSVVFALQAHAAYCPFGSPGGSLPHREGHTIHAKIAGAGCLRESPQKMRVRQEFSVDHKEGRP